MKTASIGNSVVFETDIRSTAAGDYRNVVVMECDARFMVEQYDIENDEVWNATPIKSFATLEAAIAFAEK